jgi:DnaK suppressor protein
MNIHFALDPAFNDDYMNPAHRAHFKRVLSSWKGQLLEEVAGAASQMANSAANDADPVDRASQAEELQVAVRTQDRRRRLIDKIDSSIDSLDREDYGYCEACGEDIGIQRLHARPTATHCFDCKTLAELKERQVHG